MTKPCYPAPGCAAGSQAHGLASALGYAWNVNFNNGNSDYNDHDNTAFVRAVRSVARAGEFQGEGATLRELFDAWKAARRRKVPSFNQLDFDAHWLDGLLALQEQINNGTWSPRPTTCFIAQRPKARQIHAPDFADRVMHHWLVPRLEALFEPGFIHDSFANRVGKGTHAAVDRLRAFVRRVQNAAGGHYLQLDVRNFFNTIHRPTLYAAVKARLVRSGAPATWLRLVHALLRYPADRVGVVHRSSPAERARVPAYKRLENAPPGRGLPIGNLSSQFFANVYLDALDQFVKHELKARHYVRYVDDFVLLHHDRAQLQAWHTQIEAFLRDRLRLELKPNAPLRPLRTGIDFLGYVIFPTHTRVRARVVRHAFAAVKQARSDRSAPGREHLRAVMASYGGHFSHANAAGLARQLEAVQ